MKTKKKKWKIAVAELQTKVNEPEDKGTESCMFKHS
jgi:hypothetical protein